MTDEQDIESTMLRHELVMARMISHPRTKVWNAIVEPQLLSQWWPFPVTDATFEQGGTIRFDDGEGNEYVGEITEYVEGHVLEFIENGADVVRIELNGTDEGTRLVFTHHFDQGPAPERHAVGWHHSLAALRSVLDGEPPVWPPRDPTLEKRYAHALDVNRTEPDTTGRLDG